MILRVAIDKVRPTRIMGLQPYLPNITLQNLSLFSYSLNSCHYPQNASYGFIPRSSLWKTCGKPPSPCGKLVDGMGKSIGKNKNQICCQKVFKITEQVYKKLLKSQRVITEIVHAH